MDTTSEIAFGCENHGLAEEDILERVERVSKQLNLINLLDRSVFSLSGGESKKSLVVLPLLWNRIFLFWTNHLPILMPIP